MIGFQCSAAVQQQQPASGQPAAPIKREPAQEADQQQVASLKSSTSSAGPNGSVLNSLASHINLINQAASSSGKQQQVASSSTNSTSSTITTTTTAAGAPRRSTTSPAPLGGSSANQLQAPRGGGQQTATMGAPSPGYHSAASSPSSSVASPVSSHSTGTTSSSSSSSSSSSGVHSTASPLPSSSPPSSSASSTSCPSGQTAPGSSSSVSPTISSSSSSRNPVSPPNLLDYYPELQHDGLGLTWFHEANNRAKLTAGLLSNRMIVAGDISLAEMSRYPVPIMARPPLGVSDITLENWLQEVAQSPSQRGIKLTFTSTRTVEPAFRVLARHAEHLKGPVILSADILARPAAGPAAGGNGRSPNSRQQQQQQQAQQPVDAWTFLMLCRTRFPKSIISIGWCSPTGHHQTSAGNALGWLQGAANGAQEPADSSSSLHSSADSMFELDILDSQPGGLGHHLQHPGHHHHHQQRLQQHLQLYPLAGAQQRHLLHGQQQQFAGGQHSMSHHHHLAHQLAQHQHHHQIHGGLGHHILSSSGSLNSSSGNSSGSPSPTSPVSHLMSPPHQTVATNLSLGQSLGHGNKSGASSLVDSTEQLFLAAAAASEQHQKQVGGAREQAGAGGKSSSAAAAAAAAAAMAAAVMAATSSFGQANPGSGNPQQQQGQQLPLNLNINEAGQEASAAHLSQLAQRIHSYQQQHHHHHQEQSSLSARLFQQQQQPHLSHIHKKTALGGNGASSPKSSSPKHHHNHHHQPTGVPSAASNLLLKTTHHHLQQQQHHHHHSQPQQQGYTRDMIDKMASLVKEYNLTQPVTFPVEARLLRNSLGELQRLLYQVGANSTLTVVAQQEDLISVDDLLAIRKAFAANQILFDLPPELAAALRQELELM